MRAPLWHRCHVCATVECQVPATEGACLACDEQNRNYIKSARLFPLSMRAYFRHIGVTYTDSDDPAAPLSTVPEPAGEPGVRPTGDDDGAYNFVPLIGFLWRSHLAQSLGAGERQTAAWLGTPYGSQGQIAAVLGVTQSTVSRDQANVRRLLEINDLGDLYDVADPKVGRRELWRPAFVA